MRAKLYILLLLTAVLSLPNLATSQHYSFVSSNSSPSFTLHPNPVQGDYFDIRLNFSEKEFPQAQVIITNVLGQQVVKLNLRSIDYKTGALRIHLSENNLTKGVYFVQIKSGENSKTLRLLVR